MDECAPIAEYRMARTIISRSTLPTKPVRVVVIHVPDEQFFLFFTLFLIGAVPCEQHTHKGAQHPHCGVTFRLAFLHLL